MKKKYNLGFKTVKAAGRYRSFFTPQHTVRVNGQYIGSISDDDFRIRFQVFKKDINENGNPNCQWKWVLLMYKPTDLTDAKKWISENIDRIANTLNLYLI